MANLHLRPRASTLDNLREEIEQYNTEVIENKRKGISINYIAIGAATYWDSGYQLLMVDLALLPIADAADPERRREGIRDAERIFEANLSKYTSHQVLGPYGIDRLLKGLRAVGVGDGRVH